MTTTPITADEHARILRACDALCRSGKFETGQGTCAPICMSSLGDVRKKGCAYRGQVHRELATKVLEAANG